MTTSRKDTRPMEQPGTRQRGADLGGISRNAEGGLEDAMDRMAEHRAEQPGAQRASPKHTSARRATGRRAGGERSVPPGKAAPAASDAGVPPDQQTAAGNGPLEPADEGPLESWGRAISEVVIGTLDNDETPAEPGKRSDDKR